MKSREAVQGIVSEITVVGIGGWVDQA
jgi:hypothetical protein